VEEAVARYEAAHKESTRRRIIEAAGRLFKQNGVDATGIAPLMADAGLTNGAFYAHFPSKEALVAAVIAEELRVQATTFTSLTPGISGIEELLRSYLSAQHRDHRGSGCPSAALLGEVGRHGDATRDAYSEGASEIVEQIASRLALADPAMARGRAFSVLALMTGSLQLSRAISDPRISDEILDQGVADALALASGHTSAMPADRGSEA
jgi:AcrR family transcriptional regulator